MNLTELIREISQPKERIEIEKRKKESIRRLRREAFGVKRREEGGLKRRHGARNKSLI